MTATPTPTPNYKDILFRLIEKVKRNGDYYRQIAGGLTIKAKRATDLEERARLFARAESLKRCAQDMDYTFDRATNHLSDEEVHEILMNYEPPNACKPPADSGPDWCPSGT